MLVLCPITLAILALSQCYRLSQIVRECAEFFWISRFWITCLQSSRGSEILNISTTSTWHCVLETLRHISFQTGYREVRWRQNCPIGGPLNFFRKMQKKPFFAARQLLEILWLAHISRVLSCQSSRPEDSKNVVELSLISEAFSRNAFQMEGELNSELADVIIERRAHFKQAYIQLRQAHPALPAQLRHFQV